MPQRDRQHLVGRRHFKVERQRDLAHQPVDVTIGDMPAVLAQMRGDAVSPGAGREKGGADRVRMGAAARIPDRRDMIDIDAKRSEEHTSELQSLMRISYAVFCLKKKKIKIKQNRNIEITQPKQI